MSGAPAQTCNAPVSAHPAFTEGQKEPERPIAAPVAPGPAGANLMSSFSIVYHQGSFVFSAESDCREKSLARALSLIARPGVWHVHVADRNGRPVFTQSEIEAHRRAVVRALPSRTSSTGAAPSSY